MWEWLSDRWNSLESVAWALWWLNILIIVISALATITAGIRLVFDNRLKYLERKLADPWRLSAEQRERFVAILREEPSRIGAQVAMGDPYAQDFATELTNLFIEAGWMHPTYSHFTPAVFVPTLYGIALKLDLPIGSNINREMGAVERFALKRAFDAVGIRVLIQPITSPITRKLITLQIGHRPPPPT